MKNKVHIILATALIASLAVNGYLLYSQNQYQASFNEKLTALEEKNIQLTVTVDTLTAENATLTAQLETANKTIETMTAEIEASVEVEITTPKPVAPKPVAPKPTPEPTPDAGDSDGDGIPDWAEGDSDQGGPNLEDSIDNPDNAGGTNPVWN